VSQGQVRSDSGSTSIWNGGFESDINDKFAQFDWTIGQSSFARAKITAETAHGGSRSLRIDFAGRDTTKLDDEISQRFLVKPGSRYRLDCFVRTDNLVTPEGPRVVVATGKSSAPVAASEPIAAGSSDWRKISIEFVAPQTGALVVAIRRIPKFSYDNPTKGTIWVDDFSLTEDSKAQ
jgi:hypothetical protein